MADIEASIFMRISGSSDLHKHIGAGSASRVYQGRLPPGCEYPALRSNLLAQESAGTHLGGNTGATRSTWQFDCYAETAKERRDMKNALIKTMIGQDNGRGDWAGIQVHEVVLEDVAHEPYMPDHAGSSEGTLSTSVTMGIHHEEPSLVW